MKKTTDEARRISVLFTILYSVVNIVVVSLCALPGIARGFLILLLIAGTVLFARYSANKDISYIKQGRCFECVLIGEFLFSCLVLQNFEIFQSLFILLMCLVALYQTEELQRTLLILSLILYVICFVFLPVMPGLQQLKRYEFLLSIMAILVAQELIILIGRLNRRYIRRAYENEQSLDDLLRVVELKCDEAMEATRVKNDFMANMSHEIRTPLNAICGMSQILMQSKLQANDRESVQTIYDSSHNLLHIFEDIMDYTQMDSGNFELSIRQYSLLELTGELITRMKEEKGDKDISISFSMEQLPDMLMGDRDRIWQMLWKVAENALKFTNEGTISVQVINGRESVQSSRSRKYTGDGTPFVISVVIKDTGIGMNEKTKEHLFEAFFQGDAGRSRQRDGYGLGVTIAQKLAKLMNGELRVESEFGQGTTVTVCFEQLAYAGILKEKYQKEEEHFFVAPDARVLLVDDNRVNLKVADGLLQKFEIHATRVESGEEALELIRKKEKFDLIFMDHMMPGMDGIETTERILKLQSMEG